MAGVVKAASFWLSLILLLVMALLSVRGIIDPASAAASFGVGISDPSAELYHGVYRSRNCVLAAAGLVFLAMGLWRPLAILVTLSIALPAFDVWILNAHGIPVEIAHPATVIALAALAALLWARLALTR